MFRWSFGQPHTSLRPPRHHEDRLARPRPPLFGDLETRLADSGLYDAARKRELDDLLREQGQLRKIAADLEEDWLQQQEQLEALEAELEGEAG